MLDVVAITPSHVDRDLSLSHTPSMKADLSLPTELFPILGSEVPDGAFVF